MSTTFIIVLLVVGLYMFLYLFSFGFWLQAKVSGVEITLLELFFMRLRKVPPQLIVNSLIESNKADLNIKRAELEALFLSGGNVENVIHGLIMAKKNNISLTFEEACKVDMKGFNLIEVLENEIKRK